MTQNPDNGPSRLVASPDGPVNEIDPATIRVGEAVRVVFQKVDDVYLPRWMRG